jgi:hypothetical protein
LRSSFEIRPSNRSTPMKFFAGCRCANSTRNEASPQPSSTSSGCGDVKSDLSPSGSTMERSSTIRFVGLSTEDYFAPWSIHARIRPIWSGVSTLAVLPFIALGMKPSGSSPICATDNTRSLWALSPALRTGPSLLPFRVAARESSARPCAGFLGPLLPWQGMQLDWKIGLMSVSKVTPVFVEAGGNVAGAVEPLDASSARTTANPKAPVRAIARVSFIIFIGLFKMCCRDKTPKSVKSFKQNRASLNLPMSRPCDTLEA